MSLHIEVPTLVKIREGIRVNVSLSVSQAVEHDVTQKVLTKAAQAKLTAGEVEAAALGKDDYEEGEPMNVISFWFIGGSSLVYRVGHEITQEDFVRIEAQLNELEYRSKSDRVPSNDKVSSST